MQLLWIVDYLPDIVADLAVFFRVPPALVGQLPAPLFFAWAWRLAAYGGALSARVAEALAAERDAGRRPPGRAGEVGQPGRSVKVDTDTHTLLTHPAFAGAPGEAGLFEINSGR